MKPFVLASRNRSRGGRMGEVGRRPDDRPLMMFVAGLMLIADHDIWLTQIRRTSVIGHFSTTEKRSAQL
jgi:hypothetical protein